MDGADGPTRSGVLPSLMWVHARRVVAQLGKSPALVVARLGDGDQCLRIRQRRTPRAVTQPSSVEKQFCDAGRAPWRSRVLFACGRGTLLRAALRAARGNLGLNPEPKRNLKTPNSPPSFLSINEAHSQRGRPSEAAGAGRPVWESALSVCSGCLALWLSG